MCGYFSLKFKTAEEVAEKLVNEIICRFGVPTQLFSDKGTEFCNKLVTNISELFKIRRITTTPYNARSNGFVENHNKTLKDQLYHFVSLLQRDWDKYLPTVQLMYNTTVFQQQH
jgi:transposase InsO family protein